MALTAVVPKRSGRPQAARSTVRILKTGVARLSPDLCIGSQFTMRVDKKKKRIVLTKIVNSAFNGPIYALWFSSSTAKSGLISVVSALKELGVKAEGEYAAKRRGNYIMIDVSRRLRK